MGGGAPALHHPAPTESLRPLTPCRRPAHELSVSRRPANQTVAAAAVDAETKANTETKANAETKDSRWRLLLFQIRVSQHNNSNIISNYQQNALAPPAYLIKRWLTGTN